jgi:Saccharopine dehydrogenase NADP binding domain
VTVYLLGATGFTGQLLLPRLLERGITAVAVGRRAEALQSLQDSYPGLDTAVVDVQDESALSAIIDEGDLMISTVGPFVDLGEVPLKVAVENGAHYIDSTGEPKFMASVYKQYEEILKESKQLVMTACGYDYVPGQFISELLLAEPGASEITSLKIAYATPHGAIADISSGTMSTLLRALYDKGEFFNGGRARSGHICCDSWKVKTKSRQARCLSLSGIECLELPRAHPELENVNVYLGWFGLFAPVVQAFSRAQRALARVPGYLKMMRSLAGRINVPRRKAESVMEDGRSDVYLFGEGLDEQGHVVASATLEGHNMYAYTADIMAWMAQKIVAREIAQFGVVGAARAFGAQALTEAHKELGLSWSVKAP